MRQVSNRALLCPFSNNEFQPKLHPQSIEQVRVAGCLVPMLFVEWADSSDTEYVFIQHDSILNFNKLTCSSRLEELCFPTYFLLMQGWCWTWPAPAALLRGPLTAWWHVETLSIVGKLKGWTVGTRLASFWRPWKLGKLDEISLEI